MTTGELALLETDLDPDPHRQFERWLADALGSGERMANAMNLSTVGADGTPSARMVLFEVLDADGFVFQTNTESPKARDLAANPRAALTFFWPILLRQVRVTGTVELLPRSVVAAFFAATPAPLQVMLRACRQSQVIADRAALEQSYASALASGDDSLPDDWGAYRLRASTIEFWQGRENRLQDRLRYTRASPGWRVERLVP
ncbi:MAG TPA: pyridoxamine 5'-phosphate oxidase [Chloroflexota bacterium]|jgi:pyridoxamine 5'-phosphate oxidase